MRAFFMGLRPRSWSPPASTARASCCCCGASCCRCPRRCCRSSACSTGGYWNAFFNRLLYINDNSRWPLQLNPAHLRRQQHRTGSQPGRRNEALPPQQSLQMAILVIRGTDPAGVPVPPAHFTKAYSPAPSRADHTTRFREYPMTDMTWIAVPSSGVTVHCGHCRHRWPARRLRRRKVAQYNTNNDVKAPKYIPYATARRRISKGTAASRTDT